MSYVYTFEYTIGVQINTNDISSVYSKACAHSFIDPNNAMEVYMSNRTVKVTFDFHIFDSFPPNSVNDICHSQSFTDHLQCDVKLIKK